VTASAVEWLLLAVAVLAELGCVLGVVLARDTLDRLHFTAAGSVAGALPVALAVLVRESFTQPGVNALVIAAALAVLGPLLAIETARAIRRQSGR